MPAPDEPPFDGADFDPDTVNWSPGVDYLGAWREATDAAAELTTALEAVGIDTATLTVHADTSPEGVGILRLTLPATTARDLTTLARLAATRLRRAC